MTQLTCQQRIQLLAAALGPEHPSLGAIDATILGKWITHELGHRDALDTYFSPAAGIRTRARATPHILHIASANTPHGTLQSLLRGLIIGSRNTIKLSSRAPETAEAIEHFIRTLSEPLRTLCNTTDELSDTTINVASTVIVFGTDSTIESIRSRLSPHQQLIAHGHKLSITLIEKPCPEAAASAAHDICSHNQQGCLSTHAVYVRHDAAAFPPLLAEAMADYEATHPRSPLSLSESGAISNLRSTAAYLAANDPEQHQLLTSGADNTAWTVIYRADPTLSPSPLNRCAFVHPWPADSTSLGAEISYLSTLALHPFSEQHIDQTLAEFSIPPLRICPSGKSQQPHLLWHHDGIPPLASLVTWHDIHE